jgi:hypothetical protein
MYYVLCYFVTYFLWYKKIVMHRAVKMEEEVLWEGWRVLVQIPNAERLPNPQIFLYFFPQKINFLKIFFKKLIF